MESGNAVLWHAPRNCGNREPAPLSTPRTYWPSRGRVMPDSNIGLPPVNRDTVTVPAGCGKRHLIAEVLIRRRGRLLAELQTEQQHFRERPVARFARPACQWCVAEAQTAPGTKSSVPWVNGERFFKEHSLLLDARKELP